MQRDWEPEGVIDCWTLVDGGWVLVANKTGATRLGFAVLLKFFELEGRFPRHASELPRAAVGYVAGQVKVGAEASARYRWTGRTIEYHRAQIRKALGFREPTLVTTTNSPGGWHRRRPRRRPRSSSACRGAARPSSAGQPERTWSRTTSIRAGGRRGCGRGRSRPCLDRRNGREALA